uniref:ribosomal protein S3 n=1 Tax=Trentepohlia sp. BN17 TaxID=3063876 RepID=UPI001EE1530C|nr:ribosomal protein S3 [Trentepohlia sp. BN17]UIB38709.1 ribosomal protein S3 [Trentepohlia sp. BN17]
MQKSYPSKILEDRFIRQYITPASIAQILIFRTLDYIRIEIHTAPTNNLVFPVQGSLSFKAKLGDQPQKDETTQNESEISTASNSNLSGLNLKDLQEDLALELANYKKKTLTLLFSNPRSIKNKENLLENASIESRVNLGILIKQLNKPYIYASVFAKFLSTQLENRKYTVNQAFNRSLFSGRLNGTDIAEQKSFFKGRIPLSSLDANIDYCYETAKTLYGILGVKVWIMREEN